MSLADKLNDKIRNIDPRTSSFIAGNVISSIAIVLANKWVFKTYGFNFGTLLTMIHFIVTFLGLVLCAKFGIFEVKPLRIRAVLPLSFSFCGFVVLNNLSLQYNSVGFYQICKVLTTPTIMIIQTYWYNQPTSIRIKLTLVPVLIGVIICTATDVEINFLGTMYALSAVVITSLYQIWSGTKQRELQANSMQLLIYQAPISAVMLILVIPVFDNMTDLWNYEMTSGAFFAIAFSAFLAFFVNLSIYLVIGKTSPVTYNVVGYFKLCCIIIGGFLLFDATVDARNVFGVIVTLSGIFSYTYFKLDDEARAREAKEAEAQREAQAAVQIPTTPQKEVAEVDVTVESSPRVGTQEGDAEE